MAGSVKQPFANLYFFPAAAAYAAIILPWSVFSVFGLIVAPPGLAGALGHAHEMLFGYAMAVVAGYVLGPQPHRWIWLILGLWATARGVFLFAPTSYLSAAINMLFVAVLGYRVVPRFARTAKKWRNKAVAPILVGLCLAAALFQGLFVAGVIGPLHGLLLEAILLLSLLMFFMGGRMLAPAVAGHLLKQNREIQARIQPRLEGAALLVMGTAILINLVPWAPLRPVVGVLLLICAGITLVRLLRWPLWRCLDRPDLVALALGYLWLVLGWLLIALSLMGDLLPLSTAVHGITIGALGTLTLTVMARTRVQRRRKDANAAPGIYLAAGLISLTALARIGAGTVAPGLGLHVIAAVSWSLAFMVLLAFLLRFR